MNRRYGMPREPYTYSKWPVRILLIVGALLLVTGFLMVLSTAVVMLVQFWICPALLGAGLCCFLAAGVLAVRHRVRASSTARNVVTIVLSFVVLLVAAVISSFSMAIADYPSAAAYYTSPSGTNRLMIASYLNQSYAAYPMANKAYYYPSEITTAIRTEDGTEELVPGVMSDLGVDQVLWYGDDRAEVYLRDTDGTERIIDVDFVEHTSTLRPLEETTEE